ncbi:hypothetical protein HSB1_33600 [Halogranum salarium B-1]|uniref:Uncharacterized protein n=1 Tax=Halogranum salarium B-1 TaxID=1210908 RepID=J2ZY42_9EURY|nr:hypothetical protein HSB1_33600 [Halogranum salarium B-1]
MDPDGDLRRQITTDRLAAVRNQSTSTTAFPRKESASAVTVRENQGNRAT